MHCRCDQPNCGALVRPHVVWFGESLDSNVLSATHGALDKCDMCLLVRISNLLFFKYLAHTIKIPSDYKRKMTTEL